MLSRYKVLAIVSRNLTIHHQDCSGPQGFVNEVTTAMRLQVEQLKKDLSVEMNQQVEQLKKDLSVGMSKQIEQLKQDLSADIRQRVEQLKQDLSAEMNVNVSAEREKDLSQFESLKVDLAAECRSIKTSVKAW